MLLEKSIKIFWWEFQQLDQISAPLHRRLFEFVFFFFSRHWTWKYSSLETVSFSGQFRRSPICMMICFVFATDETHVCIVYCFSSTYILYASFATVVLGLSFENIQRPRILVYAYSTFALSARRIVCSLYLLCYKQR